MSEAAYEIDGRPAVAGGPDGFYALACDPARSVVVEACAGAGKTWMLVSRILRALLEGTDPRQILAITFTRKAAAEMKSRLDEWLDEMSEAHPASSPERRVDELVKRGLGEAQARAAQAALGGLQQRLRHGGREVEIRTFHAWFAQLAAQAPLALRQRLGLPAQPELMEDLTTLQPELFRRFWRRVLHDESLRADHQALVLRHRRSSVQSWLETAWRRGDELALADAAGVLESSMPSAAELDPRCAGLAQPADRLRHDGWPDRLSALAIALGRGGKLAQDAAARLREADDALRGGDAGAALASAWKALATDKDTARQKLGSPPELEGVFDFLAEVRIAQRQHEAWLDHHRMVRLSRVLQRLFADLKRERGVVDMSDLERAALALLGDAQAAGWVQQRLDLRVQHLLIDEFQDTSPLQWHALYGWLSAYAGAGGGASGQRPPSVFIVGDPKQSIYRFRRAEPRVFEAARDFVVHGLHGHHLACDHTRRNAPSVVQALNQVFGDAASADGWTPFRPHTTASAEAGAVLALPGIARPDKVRAPPRGEWRDSLTEPRHDDEEHVHVAEARQVADCVRTWLDDGSLQPAQVMLLSRKRSHLRRLADALASVGVPYVMPEPLQLADEPEAQDLVAVLDVLASPAHDLSLARALKSPLFDASDDDLLRLSLAARAADLPWLDALTGARPVAAASPALQRARVLLSGWRDAVAGLTPHELLDRVVDEGDLMPRLLARTPVARRDVARQLVRSLLQAALEWGSGRFVSTYRFVRAVRQGLLKSPAVAPQAAVQLLTVHGAKGLEADVVVLTDADAERQPAPRATLLVDWPVDRPAPCRAAFVLRESDVPPALAQALLDEQAARAREDLNTLYVAVTRARARLVVAHTDPFRATGRSWWSRLEPVVALLEPAAAAGGAAAAPPPVAVERLSSVQPPAVSPGDPAAGKPLDQGAGVALDPRAADLGRAVHRLLEWIGQPGGGLAAGRREAGARQAAAAFGLDPAAVSEVVARASAVADSPACARFFGGPALRWAGNEVPLALDGRSLRLDRLVLLDDGNGPVWWVLDYKLTRLDASLDLYRPQLERYRQAVRVAEGPQAEVRAGFITGDGRFVPA